MVLATGLSPLMLCFTSLIKFLCFKGSPTFPNEDNM